MKFRIHALVQDADDEQGILCFAVENNVPSNRIGAEPLVDLIAGSADAGPIAKGCKRVSELVQILPFLSS